MQLSGALSSSTIIRLLYALLIFPGCTAATTPRLTDQVRANIGTVGVVSVTSIPEASVPEAKTKGEARVIGLMKGLGKGVALAALCPLAVPALSFGGSEVLLACLTSLGTPVLMVTGAAGEEKTWIPKEIEEQARVLFKDTLNRRQLQQVMKTHVTSAGEGAGHHRFVSLEQDVNQVVDGRSDYRHLASQGIDTVLEVTLVSVGFVKGDSEQPNAISGQEDDYKRLSFSLTMVARARLIDVDDNQELVDHIYNFTSSERKWSEWLTAWGCAGDERCEVEAGRAFGVAIQDGQRILARRMVDALYTAAPSLRGSQNTPIARIPHREFNLQAMAGLGAPKVDVRLATTPAMPEFWTRTAIVTNVKRSDFAKRLRASVEGRLSSKHGPRGANGSSRLEIVIGQYGFADGPDGYVLSGLPPDKIRRFCSAIDADITLKIADRVEHQSRIIWEPYRRSTDVPPPRCDSGEVLGREEGKLAGQIIDESAEVLGAIIANRLKSMP